jgi:ankyrin repeat protein
MVAQKRKMEEYESDVVSFLRRGTVSILEAVAMKLPDVFAAEILPKLDLFDTLNLAQVSKSYNDAVWSVEGVRCMDAKMEAHLKKIGKEFVIPSIHCAAGYGNLPALRALLESGEDVNKRDPHGRTALHFAAYCDRPVTLKVLIEAGADVNEPDGNGATPLLWAVYTNNVMIVMELIDAGADVNLECQKPHETDPELDGATPLHMAVQYGYEGCVVALIRGGADIHRRTNMGMTSLKYAIDKNFEKIVNLLRHLGARDD